MEKTNPPPTDEIGRLSEIAQCAISERERRIDEKVEAGTAIRAPITIVTAGPEDADDALVSTSADKIAELRMAGERREIILEPQQIFTGVPRPARDDKYIARLDREGRNR
jgi:hypothetical protein